MSAPSIQTIIAAVGGKPSKDGKAVIKGYGDVGFLRLSPDTAIVGGEWIKDDQGITRCVGQTEVPAVRIEGRLSQRNGGSQSALRDQLRAAGLEIR